LVNGPNALRFLFEMGFGSGNEFGEVFVDKDDGEVRPGGKIPCTNGFGPGGFDWTEAGTVSPLVHILCKWLAECVGWGDVIGL
jgi:hypothetical protein